MRGIDDLGDVAGRTVLLRADLNTPLDGTTITDDGRIRASLPTISKLAGRGARILILAHLGRPSGDSYAQRAAGGPSLRPVAERLSELLGHEVPLAGDVAGDSAAAIVAGLADGGVAMAENIRFEPAETSKDDAERAGLARRLAALAGPGGRYVGDGFGALHRKHASVYDLPALLPHAAGDLVLDEVAVLRLLEEDMIPRVSELLAEAARRGVEVVLPVDLVAATHYGPDAGHEVVAVEDFPADRESLDMGPATRELFAASLADAKTVFWNGPVGVFEFPPFAAGTRAVAEAISGVSGLTVVGGGDSAAAVRILGFPDQAFTHISTGGGASLEYLEGRPLPGLAALEAAGPGDRASGAAG
jgi:3-phosphoglycerate kinase